jgi:hypothetical protein
VRFAISIPQFYAGGEFDPVAFQNFFAAAEQLPYDSAWAHESLLSGSAALFSCRRCTARSTWPGAWRRSTN